MLLPLLSAAVVMMTPFNPDADQTTLAELVAKGLDTSRQDRNPATKGQHPQWSGVGCESALVVPDHPGWRIDWSKAGVEAVGGRTLLVAPDEAASVSGASKLMLSFTDKATATAAREAMERLQAACRPQR